MLFWYPFPIRRDVILSRTKQIPLLYHHPVYYLLYDWKSKIPNNNSSLSKEFVRMAEIFNYHQTHTYTHKSVENGVEISERGRKREFMLFPGGSWKQVFDWRWATNAVFFARDKIHCLVLDIPMREEQKIGKCVQAAKRIQGKYIVNEEHICE